MSRISECFKQLESSGRKAVIPYLVAGDPQPASTVQLMHQLVDDGADVIELGIPFSDPMAEGPVIQKAHERALEHGVSLAQVLEMVAQFRERDSDTPVVLMGYANPVVAMGFGAFAERASKAGVDGVLTVDLPPEESADLSAELARRSMDAIYLIAPTTTDERVASICAAATGYIYYVSLKGVTGAGNLDTADVRNNVQRVKQCTNLPVCVGFGIKDAESAIAIADCADGIVVGSALVREFEAYEGTGSDPSLADKLSRALQQRFEPIAKAVAAL